MLWNSCPVDDRPSKDREPQRPSLKESKNHSGFSAWQSSKPVTGRGLAKPVLTYCKGTSQTVYCYVSHAPAIATPDEETVAWWPTTRNTVPEYGKARERSWAFFFAIRRASSLRLSEHVMLNEIDTVALLVDRPDAELSRGEIGTVVCVHRPDAFEVEFVALDGWTYAMEVFVATSF